MMQRPGEKIVYTYQVITFKYKVINNNSLDVTQILSTHVL